MANLSHKFDYLKHLSTICTGSILLIVTFHDKLYTGNPSSQWCISFSIIAFLICLACTLGVYTILVFKSNSDSSLRKKSLGLFMLLALIFFSLGILSLVFFVVSNAPKKNQTQSAVSLVGKLDCSLKYSGGIIEAPDPATNGSFIIVRHTQNYQ